METAPSEPVRRSAPAVCFRQIGAIEAGAAQVGTQQISFGKVGPLKIGHHQDSGLQIGFGQVAAGEAGADQFGVAHSRPDSGSCDIS